MWRILTPSERHSILFLIPLIALMASMQVIGVASVMPFLALTANPGVLDENWLLSSVYVALGSPGYNSFLIFAGSAAFALLLGSNVISALTEWKLIRFSWRLDHSLSRRLLARYLARPYIFFLSQNTAYLSENLLSESKQVVQGFIIAGVRLLSRVIVAVIILGLLIALDPLLAVVAFAGLGGAYITIYSTVKRRLKLLGKLRSHWDRERFKAASEALGGAKEIKLLRMEKSFLSRFSKPSRRYARFMAQQQVLTTLPHYGLETVAFGGMISLVLYLLTPGRDLGNLLTLVGLYAFASYKLLPSLQQIFSSITSLRFSTSAVALVHRDLDLELPLPAQRSVPPLPLAESIELRNVTFAYPGRQPTLRMLDLKVAANTTVALVGVTGSGKTTTADIILGLLTPQAGALYVDGLEITDQNRSSWQANIGYVPQHIYLLDSTIAENIAFGWPSDAIDREAVARAARLAHLHDFIENELPHAYDTVVGERGVRLSGGQRQRLGIARALFTDPQVLVLDEATSALDGPVEEQIFSALREIGRSKTMVMVAHRLTTVRDCDRIFVLEQGQIEDAGTYQELLVSCRAFRRLADLAA